MKGFREKCEKPPFLGILGQNCQFWTGQNGQNGIFFKIFFTQIFYRSPTFRICTGCLPKYEWNSLKIGFKNTYFQVVLGFSAIPASCKIQHPAKWSILDSFWSKWAKREFFQKISWKIFSRLQALTNCKFQKKVMNGFRETVSRTNEQT